MNCYSSLIRTLQFSGNTSDCSQFVAIPCSTPTVCDPILSSRILIIPGKWTAIDESKQFTYPITLVCHLLTGGPACFAFSYDNDTPEGKQLFYANHKLCLDRNCAWVYKASVKDGGRCKEYLLAPLWGQHPTQGKLPIFGIYDTSCIAGDFLLKHVLKPRRLPVVFDLDETLIKARTLKNQQKEADPNTKMKRKAIIMADDGLTHEQKKRKLHELELETGQHSMMHLDLTALSQYAVNSQIQHPRGGIIRPNTVSVPFYTKRADGSGRWAPPHMVQRDVIYLDSEALFTRIRPESQDSCMIFRIRPQWLTAVQPRLAGEIDEAGMPLQHGSPIVEAFVCTTATDPAYAHEVWRVLDTGGKLISPNEWPTRIVAEVKTKYLAPALGMQPYESAEALSQHSLSFMPFALILDDRTDVWEDHVQDQILNVEKWEPYQELAKVQAANLRWEQAPIAMETLRIGAIICELQKRMFSEIDTRLLPTVQGGPTLPVPIDLTRPHEAYAEALSPPPWIKRLLPEVQATARPLSMPVPLQILPPLPANGPPAVNGPPAAAGAAHSAYVPPSDPRRAAQQAQQVVAPPLVPPRDPRLPVVPAANAAAASIPGLQRKDSTKTGAATTKPPGKPLPAVKQDISDDLFNSMWKAGLGGPNASAGPLAAISTQPVPPSSSAHPRRQHTNDSVPLGSDEGPNPSGKRKRSSEEEEDEDSGSLEENQVPGKKVSMDAEPAAKASLSPDHPVVLLSQETQAQGKSLVYEIQHTMGHVAYSSAIVKVDGKQLAYAQGPNQREAQRNAAQKALDVLLDAKASGSRREEAPKPRAAPLSGKLAAGAKGHPPLEFSETLEFLRNLFPHDVTTGQKVYFTPIHKRGDPLVKFKCVVRKPHGSKEDLEGQGEGKDYFEAKRTAAANILTSLGYKVNAYVPR